MADTYYIPRSDPNIDYSDPEKYITIQVEPTREAGEYLAISGRDVVLTPTEARALLPRFYCRLCNVMMHGAVDVEHVSHLEVIMELPPHA